MQSRAIVAGAAFAVAILCTLVPLPCGALGDFWQPLTGPGGGNVADLARQPDGDLYVALVAMPHSAPADLGYTIPIYRSRDGGNHWEPLPQSARHLAALANGDLYALTSTGVSRSRDDGDTWTALPQAPGNGTELIATASGTLLLATSDAGVYRSEDNGLVWQPSGFAGTRIGALIADANGDVHAGVGTTLFESNDDGIQWHPLTSALPAAITALARGIDGTMWIGTAYIYYAPIPTGVFSYDGIDEPALAATTTTVNDLAVRFDGTIFAATSVFADYEWGDVLRSNGPGQPWVRTHLDRNITALAIGDWDGIYAGTSYFYGHVGTYPGEGVWFTTGPTTTWVAHNRGLVHATAHALAVAPGVIYAQAGLRLARSTDHGLSWDAADAVFDILGMQLAAHPSGDVFRTSIPWVAAKPASGAALVNRSRDQGDSWQPVYGAYASPIVVTAAGSILSPAYDGVLRSTDGGESWILESEGPPDVEFQDLEPGPIARVFASTSQESFVSEDDGRTWSSIGGVGGTQMAVAPDEQSVYVLAERQPVHRLAETSPGNWSDTTLPAGPYGPMATDAHGTLYLASDTVYRLASGDPAWAPIPDTPALWSVDGGLDDYYLPGRESILFDEAGFLYVGTGNLGVLRSRLPVGSIATDTGRRPTITAWFPGANPTRGGTAFALELARNERVSLALYDVRGRLISTLWSGETLGPGRNVASWRPDPQVASGTYFYRLDVGDAARRGRVTLVR